MQNGAPASQKEEGLKKTVPVTQAGCMDQSTSVFLNQHHGIRQHVPHTFQLPAWLCAKTVETQLASSVITHDSWPTEGATPVRHHHRLHHCCRDALMRPPCTCFVGRSDGPRSSQKSMKWIIVMAEPAAFHPGIVHSTETGMTHFSPLQAEMKRERRLTEDDWPRRQCRHPVNMICLPNSETGEIKSA